jgi:uncharacterized protein with ATP-grasp and redox domains
MTSEPKSFAGKTMKTYKPQILQRIIERNNFPLQVVKRLNSLGEELLNNKVKPLTEKAIDVEQWNSVWRKYKDRTWFDIPWYFAESFFFRRILEATNYFQEGSLLNRDPYKPLKEEQLMEALPRMIYTLNLLRDIRKVQVLFESILHACLWGNRADLSNLGIIEDETDKQVLIDREKLVINDFSKILIVLKKQMIRHVAFFNDNVGLDLGFDLVLADFLLERKWVEKITFYLKPYPFFVSDAIPEDLKETLNQILDSRSESLRSLGNRIDQMLVNKKLLISTDWFFASPHHFNEMPLKLFNEVSKCDLVIMKGDANYRRLLSDRHWLYTTPITDVVSYFPTSILVLRTLKGEIIVNLQKGQAEKIEEEDGEWLVNGKRGIIQYIK